MTLICRLIPRWAVVLCVLGFTILSTQAKPKVEVGIDVLAANNFRGLEGKRVGLITNQTGVSSSGRSTVEILKAAPNVNLVALYAPEHGVYGAELAGDHVASSRDARTGLPVFSLYGDTRKPTPAMLQGIDVLIYDIQDIGCRSYTYISTLGLAMEAAGEANIEFFVLDRPNPLGGNRVEGMPLDPKFRSFVGQWDIPYVYGLTPGELARMINAQKWIVKRPKLTIVPMRGWYRTMYWEDTGLPWVPTSPHIPTAETSFFYVITGLVGEGMPINHGIGYTLPFQLLGRDDFNAFNLADTLNGLKIQGVYFRPAFYKPFYGSLKDKMCQGVQIILTDKDQVNLSNLSVMLLEQVQKFTGGRFFTKEVAPTTKGPSLFDKVAGGDALRRHFSEGKLAAELIASWQPSLEAFRKLREPYLIYSNRPAPAPAPAPQSTPDAATKNKPETKPAPKSETKTDAKPAKKTAPQVAAKKEKPAVKKPAATATTTTSSTPVTGTTPASAPAPAPVKKAAPAVTTSSSVVKSTNSPTAPSPNTP